jgi:hypothetical protein
VTAAGCLQVRRQLDAAQKASADARAEAARLAGELAARGAEVEQLTSLSLRGDATLQDYMASLKVGGGGIGWVLCEVVAAVFGYSSAAFASLLQYTCHQACGNHTQECCTTLAGRLMVLSLLNAELTCVMLRLPTCCPAVSVI